MLKTEEAKTISILSYMEQQGYKPVRKTGGEYYFNSPFRQEQKPSFTLREKAGKEGEDLWFDFGLGNDDGGDIIALAMRLENCDFRTALISLEEYHRGVTNYTLEKIDQRGIQSHSAIKLTAIQDLNHFVLLKYLREKRQISEKIAKQNLKMIWYENKGRKNLFAFGWKNESGAYELRGGGEQSFKTVTGRKDITIISANQPTENCFLFEGMLDYLSVLELKNDTKLNGDVVILNSTSLKNRFLDLLEKRQYQTIYTFFDNDKSGQDALSYLEEKSKHEDIRQQTFYAGFNDVNEYLQSKNYSL